MANELKPCDKIGNRFWKKIKKTDSCWLWIGSKSNGYGYFRFRGKMKKATHVMWFYTFGYLPNKWVLHHCDNPSCVNPEHLYLGTPQDNSNDMVKRGRSPRGTRCAQSKLNETLVRQIRNYPLSNSKTAKVFGITKGQVSKIRNFQQWSYVK